MKVARLMRQHFLTSNLLIAGVAVMLLSTAVAVTTDERRLSFYHTHTGESLDIVYSRGGEYIDSALLEIDEFLADFRSGDRGTIDPGLLDFIYEIRQQLGGKGTYEDISAYRSPTTNEMLRNRNSASGVAENSLHIVGKAIDVRLRGVELQQLRDAAIALQRGGVGYYEQSDFLHVDTGDVRRW